MQTRNIHKTLLAIFIPVLFLLMGAAILLETAFFHVNPIKIGFHRVDYGNYLIFAKELPANNDYKTISTIMVKNEAALGLQYNSKVQIILCEKQSDLNRFQPFLRAADRRNAVAVAPWPNTIYITPNAKKKYGSILGPVGHEISHILLLQNYGIGKATLLWKLQEWIPEGFAIYINDWPNYFPREQLIEKVKEEGIDLESDRLLGNKRTTDVTLPLRYMTYRYFIEYLFEKNPSTAVVQFVKEVCTDPSGMNIIFEKTFEDSFDHYVKAFWKELGHK